MPNSLVVDAQVTNYTTEPLRRVDLTVSAPMTRRWRR